MGTLGKAAGAAGAFVAGDATVIEWLEQRARSYIFTTAASPIIACALAASLDLIAAGDARRQHLWQLVAQLRDGLADTRWQLLPSPTAIQPVIIGDNHDALRIASALFERPVGTGDPAADGAQGKRASARIADRGPQRSRSGPPGRRLASAGMSVLIGKDPDLALVHGWGLGSAVWQPLLAPLVAILPGAPRRSPRLRPVTGQRCRFHRNGTEPDRRPP
jgi:hypothetical protein